MTEQFMMDVIIFDVEMGQSIFFYPQNNPEYGMLVDCGNTQNFNPIDLLLSNKLIHNDGQKHILGNLTLTNYDHDHFSGLPTLSKKVHVSTVRFPKNISAEELLALKPVKTDALDSVCHIKKTYTAPAPFHKPPYTTMTFHLEKEHFPADQEINTNNLSQVVFVEYLGTVFCIPGDLEKAGWELMLKKEDFRLWLSKTNVLIASHHGRENGYAEEIFEQCFPECIVISDKSMVHETQEEMRKTYANHVLGNGVSLGDDTQNPRKVLTTRSDGHIWIRIPQQNVREYRKII